MDPPEDDYVQQLMRRRQAELGGLGMPPASIAQLLERPVLASAANGGAAAGPPPAQLQPNDAPFVDLTNDVYENNGFLAQPQLQPPPSRMLPLTFADLQFQPTAASSGAAAPLPQMPRNEVSRHVLDWSYNSRQQPQQEPEQQLLQQPPQPQPQQGFLSVSQQPPPLNTDPIWGPAAPQFGENAAVLNETLQGARYPSFPSPAAQQQYPHLAVASASHDALPPAWHFPQSAGQHDFSGAAAVPHSGHMVSSGSSVATQGLRVLPASLVQQQGTLLSEPVRRQLDEMLDKATEPGVSGAVAEYIRSLPRDEGIRAYQHMQHVQQHQYQIQMMAQYQRLQKAQKQQQQQSRQPPQPPPPPQPNASTQAAMLAVINGMEIAGPKDDEIEPPEGLLTTKLLPYQRQALMWMSRRESGGAPPIGGILADDQGLGKTVTTISLIVCNPRQGVQRVVVPPPPKSTPAAAAAADDGVIELLNDEEDDVQTLSAKVDPSNGAAGTEAAAMTPPQPAALPHPATDPPSVIELDLFEAGPSGADTSKFPANVQLDFGTLVVCPTTLLHQWEAEVRRKTTPGLAKVYVYHGKSKEVPLKLLANFDVVVTTYQTLVQEMPEAKKPVQKQKGGGSVSGADSTVVDLVEEENEKPGGKKRKRDVGDRGGPLFRAMWHRVVLDEAQIIKNSRTLAAHAAWALRARRRWCLSGTPIQNSIDDLYSYFRFLRYEPYSKFSTFKELIKDPIMSNNPRGFRLLQAVLQSVLLRRTKQTKVDGRPIVNLPERRVRLVQREFSPQEREFYTQLTDDAAKQLQQAQSEGSGNVSYVNMLWMLLKLRQACNHPELVKGGTTKAPAAGGKGGKPSPEVAAARKLKPAMRTELAATLREGMSACVACNDIPEDAVVSVCRHLFCRQCVSALVSMAGQGAAEAELAFHCPSCNHTLGPNQTFGADALHVEGDAHGGQEAAPVRPDGSSTKVDTLMEVLRELRVQGAARAAGGGTPNEGGDSAAPSAPPAPKIWNKSMQVLRSKLPRKSSAGLLMVGDVARPKDPPMEKVIVFSQWTSMLDLVERPLRKENFEFRRLDGTMSVAARQTAIQDFTDNPAVCVMLVSLKAASLGVNLVCANHVVLLDLWFNPSVEDQAIDRAHRIGQEKPVNVTRITIKDSIEDRIMALQDKKQQLVEASLGEGEVKGSGLGGRLTMQDLAFLFGVGGGGGGGTQ